MVIQLKNSIGKQNKNPVCNGKMLENFPLQLGMRKEFLCSELSLNILLEAAINKTS